MQLSFALFILVDAYQSCDEELRLKIDEIPDVKIGFTRFISGMIMHIMTNEEMKNGMRMMKYAANHWWKFKYHRIAFLAGFFQFTALFAIALCNYLVITISTTTLDIAKDFTALLIIADFDEIFGKRASKLVLNLIEESDYKDLFKIETTTSKDAKYYQQHPDNKFLMHEDEVYEKMVKRRIQKNEEIKRLEQVENDKRDKEEQDGSQGKKTNAQEKPKKSGKYLVDTYPFNRPKILHIAFSSRSFENKVFFSIYKFFRFIHVTIWFYFFPFIALVLTYMLPLYWKAKERDIETEEAVIGNKPEPVCI